MKSKKILVTNMKINMRHVRTELLYWIRVRKVNTNAPANYVITVQQQSDLYS